MTMSDRPKVGPADPETRRKKLREILDTPTKGTGVAAKPTVLDAVKEGVAQGSDTLPNGKKRRAGKAAAPKRDLVKRYGPKGQTEDEITGQ